MNSIIDYSIKSKVLKHSNTIIEKALESMKTEDSMIRILANEVSTFIYQIINKREKHD